MDRVKRLHPSPSMVVALCALVLTGTGGAYAAVRLSGVRATCSAVRNGRSVACRVVSARDTTTALGPTTLTQPPGYALLPATISNNNVEVNSQSSSPYTDEWQRANVYSYSQVSSQATLSFRTFLLSSDQIAGSPMRVRSVNFCFGLQDSSLGPAQPAYLTLTRALVREFAEANATSTQGPTPVYSSLTLVNEPLSIGSTSTGETSCRTISVSPAPAVRPGGYLTLDVQLGFVAPDKGNGSPFQGWVYFGRVTTTYGP